MKVLHVIPSISKHSGGPGQIILPMCRALKERGVDVLIATTNAELTSNHGLPDLGSIQDYKGVPAILFHSQLGKSFKYSSSLSSWLDANVHDFDLVHIHAVFNHACIAAAKSCRRQNVPYIIRPLGTLDPWSMRQRAWKKTVFWQLVGKQMLSDAAAIHYTSQTEKEVVEQSLGLSHGTVVPLGVGEEFFAAGDNDSFLGKFPELQYKRYVLVLSRLVPTKGVGVLLNAFLSLTKDHVFSSWHLVLAGDGPEAYMNQLRTAAEKRNVVFTGWLDGESKLAALRCAALLALPSEHENFGLCLMEGLASGVPVLVSAKVNLASEILRARAGWISETDQDSLEKALSEVLLYERDRDDRGHRGRELATKYLWPRVAKELCELYRSVTRN
jgi:glycosyltransferase involved in cell wall biosynthesis